MAWPDHLLYPLPDGISDVAGAMLEPLGVALHAVDLGHVRAGGSVAIVGCGPIGLLAIQLVRAVGAATVAAVEPLAHRRRAAVGFGADLAVTPEQAHAGALEDVIASGGVDVAIEIAGTDDAIALAMHAAAPGARVVLAGIPDTDRSSFPASVARRKGLTILMSRRMNGMYPRTTALVRGGRVDVEPIVTDRFELAQVEAAFTAATARAGLKTVVEISRR